MRRLMLGNEAIARGLLENGCAVATSYPGTPASEILASVAAMRKAEAMDMHVQQRRPCCSYGIDYSLSDDRWFVDSGMTAPQFHQHMTPTRLHRSLPAGLRQPSGQKHTTLKPFNCKAGANARTRGGEEKPRMGKSVGGIKKQGVTNQSLLPV